MFKKLLILGVFGFISSTLSIKLFLLASNITQNIDYQDAIAFNSGQNTTIGGGINNLDFTTFLFLPATLFAFFLTIYTFYFMKKISGNNHFLKDLILNIIVVNIGYLIILAVAFFVMLATCNENGLGSPCQNTHSFFYAIMTGSFVAGLLLSFLFRIRGIFLNGLQMIIYTLLSALLVMLPIHFLSTQNTQDTGALNILIIWECGMFMGLGVLSSLRKNILI